MPRLSEIASQEHSYLHLPSISWFAEAANHKGLVRRGVYLLSGPPGAGKTTIALQMRVKHLRASTSWLNTTPSRPSCQV